jgi:antitoxin component YwqK of YwqJK toxin-antitoxin module
VVEVYYSTAKAAEIPIIAEEKPNGIQKEFSRDGRLKNVFRFENGKRHGVSEYYKADGTLLYANNYSNGEHAGKYISMLEDGTIIKEGYYDKGVMTGRWIIRDKSGTLTNEMEYKNGKLHGTYKSYSNGALREETSHLDGKKDGVSKLYDKDTGALSTEKVYKDDETVAYKSYYQDGRLHAAFSTNADKTSSTVYYDPQGNIINEAKYNQKKQPVGVHMLIMKEGNSYRISNVDTYDDSGKLLKKVLHGQGGNYIEVSYDGDVKHGQRIDYDAAANQKTVTYYFRDKPVTEKEFKELSEKKKP